MIYKLCLAILATLVCSSFAYTCQNSELHIPNSYTYSENSVIIDGSYVYVVCYFDYELHGHYRVQCYNGQWVVEPNKIYPTCQKPVPSPIPIPSSKCPAIPNVPGRYYEFEIKSKNRDYFIVGDKLWFSCQLGYVIIGAKDIECITNIYGEAVWSDEAPTCVEAKCYKPDIPYVIFTEDKPSYHPHEVVYFSCPPHYELVGNTHAKCEANGKFSKPLPTCRIIQCKEEFTLLNGAVSPPNGPYAIKTVVKFECDDGYFLVGDDMTVCQDDGTFNNDAPTCEPVMCTEEFDLANGQVTPATGPYGVGDVVEFECDDGYFLVGDEMTVCQNNGDFNNDAPTCEPVMCTEEFDLANGQVTPATGPYGVGDVVEFECDDGYFLVGDDMTVCQNNGDFNNDAPTCEPTMCDTPNDPENGEVVDPQEMYEVGESVWFRCDSGFKLVGTEKLTCQDNGEFSPAPPTCKKIIACKPVDKPTYGVLFPRRDYYAVGSYIRFYCYRNYAIVGSSKITCLKGGEWDAEPPKCLRACPRIYAPTYGYFDPKQRRYVDGDTVTVRCNEGYEIKGDEELSCRYGRWSSDVPKCVRVDAPAKTCKNVCNQQKHDPYRDCQCHYDCHYDGSCCHDYYYYNRFC